MTFANVDEARRYVEMKRAGLATSFDEAATHELVESAIWELEQTMPLEWYGKDELDTALQTEREATATSTREDILGTPEALAAEVDVGFLMRALEARIERDQYEACAAAVKHREKQIALAAEIEASRKAQRKEAAADRKRKRLADGGGS